MSGLNQSRSFARTLAVLGAATIGMTAHAQYDLGTWNLSETSLSPGIGTVNGTNTGANTWTGVNNYKTWAGGINWTATSGSNSGAIGTICSSFNQQFNISMAFSTHEWFLGGASNGNSNTSLVTLGNNSTVALSTVDTTAGETSTTFLRAAELFGYEYSSAITNSPDAAALQLAIWQTLYNPAYVPNIPDHTSQLYIDELKYYNAGQAFNVSSALDKGYLSSVQWYQFTASSGNGQGQFHYHPPAGTPEPVTIVLGVAGILIAAKRRMKAREG